MIRFYLTVVLSAIIVGADILHQFAVSLIVGLLAGAGMFLFSLSRGGAVRPIGLAAPQLFKDIPKTPSDPTANIGCAIAAAGIASSAVTNQHYPLPFRIFYGVCIALGIVIALIVSYRYRNTPFGTNDPPPSR